MAHVTLLCSRASGAPILGYPFSPRTYSAPSASMVTSLLFLSSCDHPGEKRGSQEKQGKFTAWLPGDWLLPVTVAVGVPQCDAAHWCALRRCSPRGGGVPARGLEVRELQSTACLSPKGRCLSVFVHAVGHQDIFQVSEFIIGVCVCVLSFPHG